MYLIYLVHKNKMLEVYLIVGMFITVVSPNVFINNEKLIVYISFILELLVVVVFGS